MTRSVSLFVAAMWARFSKTLLFSQQRSAFFWLLFLELTWRAGPLRITEVMVTFLTLANPVQPSTTSSAFHHEFAIIRHFAVAVDSANPRPTFAWGSNMGELCWPFHKDGDVFTCKALKQTGPHFALLEAKYCRIFPFAQKRSICNGKEATVISTFLLFDISDVHYDAAWFGWYSFTHLFLYTAVIPNFSNFLHVHGMWTRDERTVNFSVRVQSWSAKVESDPVLIRKILENHQSDPVLICPWKNMHFLPQEAKQPREAK